jgi:hypothetical protein
MSVTENELEERAVARRVTLKDVKDSVLFEYYFTAADGVRGGRLSKAGRSGIMQGKAASLEQLTFCVLVLKNGFTVVGQSACADPANYQQDLGERIARSDAEGKIWVLLGYELKTELDKGEVK